MTKQLSVEKKLDIAIEGISALIKRVDSIEETQKAVSKGRVKGNTSDADDKDKLPYGSKIGVMEKLTVKELKELIPKSDFMDKGMNLNYKDYIEFFKQHNLGGRPWITANEQVKYFLLPLKDAYKISDAKWNKKMKMIHDDAKTKLIDAESKLKKEGKKWTEKQKKSYGYKITNLQNIMKLTSTYKC